MSQQHVEVLGPQTPSPSTQQDREEAARQVGAQPHVLAVAGSWVEKVHRVSSRSLSCCLSNVCEAEGSPEVVLLSDGLLEREKLLFYVIQGNRFVDHLIPAEGLLR